MHAGRAGGASEVVGRTSAAVNVGGACHTNCRPRIIFAYISVLAHEMIVLEYGYGNILGFFHSNLEG